MGKFIKLSVQCCIGLLWVIALLVPSQTMALGYLSLAEKVQTLEQPVVIAAEADLQTQTASKTNLMLAGQFKSQIHHQRHLAVVSGDIEFGGILEDTAFFVGGKINVLPTAVAKGELRIIGGHVNIAGQMFRDVVITAENAVINAEIHGNLQVTASDIVIGKQAKVTGHIYYKSKGAPVVEAGSTLLYSPVAFPASSGSSSIAQIKGFYAKLFILSMSCLALVWVFLFPSVNLAHHDLIIRTPGKCLLIGLGTVLLVPIVSLVAMGSIVGMSLGFLAILLFFVINTLGFASMGFSIGAGLVKICQLPHILENKRARPILAAIGMSALVLLAFYVKFGVIIDLAAFVLGLGAIVQLIWSHLRVLRQSPVKA